MSGLKIIIYTLFFCAFGLCGCKVDNNTSKTTQDRKDLVDPARQNEILFANSIRQKLPTEIYAGFCFVPSSDPGFRSYGGNRPEILKGIVEKGLGTTHYFISEDFIDFSEKASEWLLYKEGDPAFCGGDKCALANIGTTQNVIVTGIKTNSNNVTVEFETKIIPNSSLFSSIFLKGITVSKGTAEFEKYNDGYRFKEYSADKIHSVTDIGLIKGLP